MGRYLEVTGWVIVAVAVGWLSIHTGRDWDFWGADSLELAGESAPSRPGVNLGSKIATLERESPPDGMEAGVAAAAERAFRPRLPEAVSPEALLTAVAEQLFYGPPTSVQFHGEVDLAVALDQAKYLRGRDVRVPVRGLFANLGQGSGMASTKLWSGDGEIVEMHVYSQKSTAIAWLAGRSRVGQSEVGRSDVGQSGVAPGISLQPAWMVGAAGEAGQGPVAAFGSPVGLMQWLPHHFELEWCSRDGEGPKGRVNPLFRQYLGEDFGFTARARAGFPVWEMVGVARGGISALEGVAGRDDVAAVAGASLPANQPAWGLVGGSGPGGGLRGVSLPAPHWVAVRLESLPGGQVRPTEVNFYRLHPLREKAEVMLHMEWQDWLPAPHLQPADVQWLLEP